MNATEFRQARAQLGQSDEELAGKLGIAPRHVSAWSAGSRPVPTRFAKHIEWLVAAVERENALQGSGLPECEWMNAHLAEPYPDDSDKALKQLETGNAHFDSCPVCAARERYVTERFGPMPPLPQRGWLRVLAWLDRVPSWARPAAVGAAALAVGVSLRVVLALPFLFSDPAKVGEALLAVVVASGAGAAGGFAYTVTRPTLRRLGVPGAYLMGIVCVFAYMGALALVAPVVFGEPLIVDRAGLVIFAAVSAAFGILLGHSWFRGRSDM
jgi:transcriptional regulator with XRE-family HTH domain